MYQVRGKIFQDHKLAPYTTWHIGGMAKVFYQPQDLADLKEFFVQLDPKEKIYWLGAGSNVLIADAGLDGVVIYAKDNLNKIEKLTNNNFRVEAGVFCPKLAGFCKQESLIDGAFLVGIPGTIGGALAMNAGAFGSEIWSFVTAIETVDKQGKISLKKAEEFSVNYREIDLAADEWIIAGHFNFSTGNFHEVEERIKTLLAQRYATQPLAERTCGSVFRNPPNDYAGRLIEQCGLKGMVVGDAMVSQKHANFIVNRGKATAADVLQLMQDVQAEVQAKFGVGLVPEVRILGYD
ncbi:MAG: UDP-N-acetylmuramate dehydrogenase [Gammaproteobacteria bacterium]|nr:UDP-N-acetylmuramate dehydrogenase [Gammaproteobacteria bacterium]